jgi:SWIM zinc finger
MKNYPNGVSRKLDAKNEKDKCLAARLLIRHWLWSWSQDACETKEEFHLSAALFEKYLQSDELKNIFDPRGKRTAAAESEIEEIVDFVRRNVEPLVPFFAFHLRKHMHTFETNSNSAHEGTNHGIKSHSAAVKPQHTTLDATDRLCFQAQQNERKITSIVVARQSQTSLHSNLPTASTLTELGNGLVEAQWNEKENYDICGPFGYYWHCLRRTAVAHTPTMPCKIPQFVRVRTVKLCSTSKQLTCSCQYFERVGIPCRHIMKVMSVVLGSSYKGVTLDDVKVLWSRDYYFHSLDLGAQSAQ